MEASNRRLSDKEFFQERQQVFADSPLGKEIDLNEATEYFRSIPPTRNYALKVAEAKKKGEILLQGSEGGDTMERHIEVLQCVQDEGQADLLSTWVDALTRNHHYQMADQAVEKAIKTGKVILNGFPMVHYGVAGTRKMTESVKLPVSLYANGPDMRLIAEVAFAGGLTSDNMGGSLCAFWGYTNNLPLEVVIRNYQYTYRLAGYYSEKAAPLCLTSTGAVSGLIAPSIILASSIIEGLIAAGQGVKYIEVYRSDNGNLVQDVATVTVLRKLGREYMDRLGYEDVVTYVGTRHPRDFKFPADHAQMYVILGWCAKVAVLGGADIIHFYTIDEGIRIPQKENNAATHRYIRMMLNMWRQQDISVLGNKEVLIETQMVEREVRAILDMVLEMGDGDVVVGAIRAVEAGVLDQPFAGNQKTLCKVMGVRDAHGAVRYLDHGNLPFTRDIIEYHKEKIAEREKKEGRKISYDAVIGDIFAPSRGQWISRPGWEAEEPGTEKRGG
jgi:methylaspartate mutase epsilon subunit